MKPDPCLNIDKLRLIDGSFLVELNLRSGMRPVTRAIFNVLDLNRGNAHASKIKGSRWLPIVGLFDLKFSPTPNRLLLSRDLG